MDIREEIARTVRETMFQREWIVPPSVRFAVADALMPLVARIQAQAWDEGFDSGHYAADWESRDCGCRDNPYRADRQENPT